MIGRLDNEQIAGSFAGQNNEQIEGSLACWTNEHTERHTSACTGRCRRCYAGLVELCKWSYLRGG